MADIESSAEDVFEIPFDDKVTEEKVAARSFGPRIYRRNKVYLTIVQIDHVQNPLRVVSQKHKNDSLGSLQAKKYQCGTGFITMASSPSGTFGAANVDNMLEHCEKKRFRKQKLSLAAADSLQRRSCI